jgi:hypothetical protein
MESKSSLKIKAISLSDLTQGATLGTGKKCSQFRFVWKSSNLQREKNRKIFSTQNNEEIRYYKIKTNRSHNERN